MTKSNDRNNSSQHNSSRDVFEEWVKTYYMVRRRECSWNTFALRADHEAALQKFIMFLRTCDHELLGFHSLDTSAVIGELARMGSAILSIDPAYVSGPSRRIVGPFDFVSYVRSGVVMDLNVEDREALEAFASLVSTAPDCLVPIPADCTWSHLVGWLAVESHAAIKTVFAEFDEAGDLLPVSSSDREQRESERAESVLAVFRA